MEIEEAIEKYANEGVCVWCAGKREITHDPGKDTEWVEKCPVCNSQDEPDFTTGQSEEL